MIALLASLAIRLGVPERFARAAGIVGVVLLLLILLLIAKCAYDRSVIQAHEAERAAKVERDARKAEHRADEDARPVQQAIAAEKAAMEGAIRDAVQNNPDEVRRPVGPASSAVIDQLRRRAP